MNTAHATANATAIGHGRVLSGKMSTPPHVHK